MWLPDIHSAGLDRYICSQMFGALKVEKPKCEKWTTWSSDDWRHQNSVCILAKYFDQVNIYTASRSLFGWRTPNWTDLIYLVCWEFSRSSTFYESSVNQVNSGSRIKDQSRGAVCGRSYTSVSWEFCFPFCGTVALAARLHWPLRNRSAIQDLFETLLMWLWLMMIPTQY